MSTTTHPMVEHFRGLFEYEKRANRIALDGLARARKHVEDVGVASLAAPWQRGVDVFAHAMMARRIWLHRLRPDLMSPPGAGIFPPGTMEGNERELAEQDAAWTAYLELVDEAELAREFEYARTEDGARFRSRVRGVLTHVFNHGTYHRGQIAMLIASCGVKPDPTDFILWARERVG